MSDKSTDHHVLARILPKGHDEVFTGEIDPKTNRPTKHKKGELIAASPETAKELEERGFVEIEAA